jgi:hypothetical protein
MKVFISWSGDLSKELGEALRKWIPGVIQQVKPYFTPNDIEKGARWSTDIAVELGESKIGIICLTSENLEKPWVMFEAGALSKQLDTAYVCPILFDIDSSDLKGPLIQFQATSFNKPEVKKLISTINQLLGDDRLDDTVLNTVFDMWWPKLDEQVKSIIQKHNSKSGIKEELRNEREILEEILALTRMAARRTKGSKTSDDSLDPVAYGFLVRGYLDIYKLSLNVYQVKDMTEEILGLRNVIQYITQNALKGSDDYDEILSALENMDES